MKLKKLLLSLALPALLAPTQWAQVRNTTLYGSLTVTPGPISGPLRDFISVKDYGAVCDGTTDDTAAIQSAFNAISNGGALIFPPGVTCALKSYGNSSGNDNWELALTGGSSSANIYIFGNGATLLNTLSTNNASNLTAAIHFSGSANNLYIDRLNVTGQHPTTLGDTSAFESGVAAGGVTINYLQITNSVFRDLSRPLNIGGYSKARIASNQFLMTNGRDSGSSTNGAPNVGIWVGANFDATNNIGATASNTELASNYYNGSTSGTVGGVSGDAGDGLVFGQSAGWNVHDNTVVNFSFEGIYVLARPWQYSHAPATPTHVAGLIANNAIDCTLVTGAPIGNYGIRSDESDMTIEGNVIRAAIRGILVDGLDALYPNTVYNSMVRNNSVEMLASVPSGTMGDPSEYGIREVNISGATVENNSIHFASYVDPNLTQIQGVTFGPSASTVHLRRNTVRADALGATSAKLYAYWINNSTGITMDGNTAWNCDYGVYATNANNPDIFIPAAVFQNVTTPVSGSTSQITWVNQQISFTPGAGQTGYWRLGQWSGPGPYAEIAGRLRVTGAYDNKVTDEVFEFDYGGYGNGGHINETRFSTYNNGFIGSLRLSTTSSSNLNLDLNVNSATAPSAITLTLENNYLAGVVLQAPTYSPTVGSTVVELNVSEGLASTGPLVVGSSGTQFQVSAAGIPTFGGTNTTGSSAASWGSNCPAVSCSAPYTWVKATAADGSTIYIPAFK